MLSSCDLQEVDINDINFSNKSHQFEIALDCYITTELQQHYIKLTKPADYSSGRLLSPISNAIVYVSDSSNDYLFFETEYEGIYKSDNAFAPIVGGKYNLYIKVDDKEYFASDSVVSVSKIDFLQMKLPQRDYGVTGGNSIYFNGDRHDFGYPENNRWLWLDEPLDFYHHPFSYEMHFNFTHKGAEPQGLFPEISYGYGFRGAPTHSITIRKYSISDDYHKFLLALFSETEWKAGIFSTISGNLPTNISHGATGYFYIMDVDFKEITVNDLLE